MREYDCDIVFVITQSSWCRSTIFFLRTVELGRDSSILALAH